MCFAAIAHRQAARVRSLRNFGPPARLARIQRAAWAVLFAAMAAAGQCACDAHRAPGVG